MNSEKPFVEEGPEGVSTWVARFDTGDVLSSAFGHTFQELRTKPGPKSISLYRGGESKLIVDIPYGESPYFLRRVRVTVSADGSGRSYEWGACIGSEDADGNLDLRWLLHDGSVIRSNTTDLAG